METKMRIGPVTACPNCGETDKMFTNGHTFWEEECGVCNHVWTPLHIFEGDLYRGDEIIREKYAWHYHKIENLAQLKATLRAGPYTWPGSYEIYFITSDGDVLCYECVIKNWTSVVDDFINTYNTGWTIVGTNVFEEEAVCGECSRCL